MCGVRGAELEKEKGCTARLELAAFEFLAVRPTSWSIGEGHSDALAPAYVHDLQYGGSRRASTVSLRAFWSPSPAALHKRLTKISRASRGFAPCLTRSRAQQLLYEYKNCVEVIYGCYVNAERASEKI